jgi:hypothetical protein
MTISNETYKAHDIYLDYVEHGGTIAETEINNALFEFNKLMVKELIKGNEVQLGFRLASLRLVKIKRNFNKPTVDWKETTLLKKELLAKGEKLYDSKTGEGTKYIVYYTDEYYLSLHWFKTNCVIKHKKYYEFVLSPHFRNNDLKELRYNPVKLQKIRYLNDIRYRKLKTNSI